jgi:hypothetical protein
LLAPSERVDCNVYPAAYLRHLNTKLKIVADAFAGGGAESRHCYGNMKVQHEGSKKLAPLLTAIVSPTTHSISQRSVNLNSTVGATKGAQEQFRRALAVARNPSEREFLHKRISACEQALPL